MSALEKNSKKKHKKGGKMPTKINQKQIVADEVIIAEEDESTPTSKTRVNDAFKD